MFTTLEKPKSKTLKRITCICHLSVDGKEIQKPVDVFLCDAGMKEIREELKKITENTLIAFKVQQSTIAHNGR